MAELRAQIVDAVHQVVAIDVRHLHVEPQPGGDLAYLIGAAGRVQAARIGDHLNAALDACGEHLFHLAQEGAGITQFGVAQSLLVQDQHGQLGQPVPGEHVDVAAVDHLARSGKAVAEEPAAVRDTYWACGVGRRHVGSTVTSGWPLSSCWPACTKTSPTVPAWGDVT